MNKQSASRAAAETIRYAVLFVVSLLILLPFVYLLSSSFKTAQEINLSNFFPKHWTGENYKAVFEETVILRSFLNTFAYIIPPVLVGVFMSALAAYGFARLDFPGSKVIFSCMMATLVIPNINIMIPSYVMFANFYKWVGTPLPVMIPAMCGSTVMMFFFLNYIRMLPKDYEEAAILDGMSRGGIFITIVFPLVKPAVITQILLCFIGIMCHVGIDVGTNTTAPKILMERIGMTLDDAAFATSLYFIFRTAGCFLGSFILRQMSPKSFFGISVVMMLAAMVGLFIFHDKAVIYACIALIGFGNSNVFSVIFSQALLYLPGKKNEVSGLMIMGLFGGTVFPLAMGVASDTSMGQNGAIAVMTVGVLYLLFYTFRIKK